MKELLFGTAGIPISTPKPGRTIEGIEHIKRMGLGAMELEFVRSVNIKKENTPQIKAVKEKEGVALTSHGQYFINLNSQEEEKMKASVERVLNAARIAHLCAAWSMTFHAGFYMKQEPKSVYDTIKKELKDIVQSLKDEGNTIWIRPETTGKETQFGSMNELLDLSSELEQVMPCIDFAHLHARTAGKENTLEEFRATLESVEKKLGKEGLHNMHMHMAGIDYGAKGEKKHLFLEESDMNYKDLMKALKEFGVRGVLICESPNIEEDALLMKKYYDGL